MLEANTILKGRYRIVRQIGLGDLGAVYEAVDENLGDSVALKELVVRSAVLQEMFRQDAPRLGRLRHAALPRVTHQFREQQGHYLVMDYVPGETLAQMMSQRDEPFPVEQVLRWADELLQVLVYLHGHEPPLIHCDIKPSNIKLDSQGKIILLNIALPKGGPFERSEGETRVRYVPLEQIRGMGTNQRSDLYALAATLYYLLTAVYPPDALTDRAKKLIEDEADSLLPLHELNPQVSLPVSEVIMQGLALNPAQRPISAKNMRLALQQALHPQAETFAQPVVEEPIEVEEEEYRPIEAIEGERKWMRLLLAMLLLLAVGGGASMWWFFGSNEASTQAAQESASALPSPASQTSSPALTDTAALPTADLAAQNIANLAEPTATIPPTPIVTLLTGSLAERSQQPIIAANSGEVQQLARWGRGTANQVLWLPTGESVLIASSIGVYRYDPSTSQQTLLIETKSTINEIALAPDGIRLAIAFEDNTIELWNIQTQTYLGILNGHTYSVRSVAFSPEGNLLASGSDDGSVKVWDLASSTLRYSFEEHTSLVLGVTFAPDGTLLASASNDGTIRLWDLASGANRYTLTGHTDGVRHVAFAPNGQTIASASLDNTINIWDVASGGLLKTLAGHSKQVRRVAFSPDGVTLVSASDDKTVKVWDVAAGLERKIMTDHASAVRGVAFSPDGTRLVSNTFSDVKIWESQSDTILHRTRLSDQIHNTTFSPDGTRMATTSGKGRLDVWDVATGEVLHTFSDHADEVLQVTFSPDSALLASASADERVKIWEVESGNLLQTLTGPVTLVSGVAFSPDVALLAATSGNGSVKVWQVADGQLIHNLTGHTDQTLSVAFSPNGSLLASTSADNSIKVWDVKSGSLLQTLSGHTDWVWRAIFSPDGNTLASASADSHIHLWDVQSGALRQSLVGDFDWVRDISFSPDGTLLASASNNFYQSDYNVKLWDVPTGTLLRSFDRHTFTVNSVTFTFDGRLLASSSEDGTVRFWGVPAIGD